MCNLSHKQKILQLLKTAVFFFPEIIALQSHNQYSEYCQTSRMEFHAKIVDSFNPLIISEKAPS